MQDFPISSKNKRVCFVDPINAIIKTTTVCSQKKVSLLQKHFFSSDCFYVNFVERKKEGDLISIYFFFWVNNPLAHT